jgi:hypothetical protein
VRTLRGHRLARKGVVPKLVGGALLIALTFSGCRTTALAFKQDKRIELVSPTNLSTVHLPFTIRWTTRDFRIQPPSGRVAHDVRSFAVLVDRSPMPPGEGLRYFARGDSSCLRTPGCPAAQYLGDRNIFLTTNTTFRVQGLADTRPHGRASTKDAHDITIVLLDGSGRRIGEAAFTLRVFVSRANEARS